MSEVPRLRPEDIEAARFGTVRFGEGYHEEEVDDFLTEVRDDLRRRLLLLDRLAGGGPDALRGALGPRLSPQDVQRHTFRIVRFREGYDPREVDAFLDTVVNEFGRLDRELRSGG